MNRVLVIVAGVIVAQFACSQQANAQIVVSSPTTTTTVTSNTNFSVSGTVAFAPPAATPYGVKVTSREST